MKMLFVKDKNCESVS